MSSLYEKYSELYDEISEIVRDINLERSLMEELKVININYTRYNYYEAAMKQKERDYGNKCTFVIIKELKNKINSIKDKQKLKERRVKLIEEVEELKRREKEICEEIFLWNEEEEGQDRYTDN